MPDDIDNLQLPEPVLDRVQYLLDKQSLEGRLSPSEREEAEIIVNSAELLSLVKLRAKRARGDE